MLKAKKKERPIKEPKEIPARIPPLCQRIYKQPHQSIHPSPLLHLATHTKNVSAILFLLRSKSLVSLSIHQLIKLLGTLLINLNLDDPTAAVAVILGNLVNGGGLLLEQDIALDDLALDGGVDVAGGLDGLDGANGIAGLDEVA